MKTSELIGVQLDWAVAKCKFVGTPPVFIMGGAVWMMDDGMYKPSTNWSQGGPIIEREIITLDLNHTAEWLAQMWDENGKPSRECGPTPLIAAMRAFVASKLGAEIEIPEELK